MPIRPRKIKKTRCGHNLTPDQELYLLKGFCLDGHKPEYNHGRLSPLYGVPFRSENSMKRAWERNKSVMSCSFLSYSCPSRYRDGSRRHRVSDWPRHQITSRSELKRSSNCWIRSLKLQMDRCTRITPENCSY